MDFPMSSLSISSIRHRNNLSLLEITFFAFVKTMIVKTLNVFVGQLDEKHVEFVMLQADNN